MENISNVKIEKLKADMVKTQAELAKSKAKTSEIQAKIREQEKSLRLYEDMEIAARWRLSTGNEDFAAQLKQNQAAATVTADSAAEKEEQLNANHKTE